MTDDARSLHVTWDDPLPPARAAREMSGLDYLRKIAKGELPPPPIARLWTSSSRSWARGARCLVLGPEKA